MGFDLELISEAAGHADTLDNSHKSIIAYLASANLPKSSAALREELAEQITLDDATVKKYEGLLEKKWTSVVRLQKKVSPQTTGLKTRSHAGTFADRGFLLPR